MKNKKHEFDIEKYFNKRKAVKIYLRVQCKKIYLCIPK